MTMMEFMAEYLLWFTFMVGFPGLTVAIINAVTSKWEHIAPFEETTVPPLWSAIRKVGKALAAGLWIATVLIIIGAASMRFNEMNLVPVFLGNIICACAFVCAAMLEPQRAGLWHCTARVERYEVPLSAYNEIVRRDRAQRMKAENGHTPATLGEVLSQLTGVRTVQYRVHDCGTRAFIFFEIERAHDTPRIKSMIEYIVKRYVEGRNDAEET